MQVQIAGWVSSLTTEVIGISERQSCIVMLFALKGDLHVVGNEVI